MQEKQKGYMIQYDNKRMVRSINPNDIEIFQDIFNSHPMKIELYEMSSNERSILFVSRFNQRIQATNEMCRQISETYDESIGIKEYKSDYGGEERHVIEFRIGSENRDEVLRFCLYALGTPVNRIDNTSEHILENSITLENYFLDKTSITRDEISDILPDNQNFEFIGSPDNKSRDNSFLS